MTAAPRAARSTRRALLTAGGTSTLVALGGCGGTRSSGDLKTLPPDVRGAEAAILNRLLDTEHRAIAAYTAGIPLLSGPAQVAAKHFLDQELSHAGELAGLIKQARGKSHEPSPSYYLGRPRGSADILRLLHTLERVQIDGYLRALPTLSPGQVRAAIASILADEAQHVAILRSTLGIDPLPAAFVTGNE